MSIALRTSFLLAVAGLCVPAGAQQQPAPLKIDTLKGGVYVAEGGAGGNSGIIVGQTGVVIIDAKTTPASGKDVLDEAAKLSPKPVNTAILTHSDGDHVNGLAAFPKGITVIAQENNKKEQEEALSAGGRGAPPRDYLPNRVVTKEKETTKIDGVNMVFIHTGPAHTSGDLAIYLPDQKIVFTGDLIATQRPDPLIHLEKHGSADGWVKFVKTLTALNADTYVPGHGDIQTKAQVEKRLADTEAKVAKIKSLVKQGKSLDEIRTAVGDPPPAPAKGGGRGGPAFASFTETTYQELTKK